MGPHRLHPQPHRHHHTCPLTQFHPICSSAQTHHHHQHTTHITPFHFHCPPLHLHPNTHNNNNNNSNHNNNNNFYECSSVLECKLGCNCYRNSLVDWKSSGLRCDV